MRVKIDFNDGTTLYPSQPSRRKIAVLFRERTAKHGVFEGEASVFYGKGYKNEFSFSDKADLEAKLWPCLEDELVKEFE